MPEIQLPPFTEVFLLQTIVNLSTVTFPDIEHTQRGVDTMLKYDTIISVLHVDPSALVRSEELTDKFA